MPTTQEETKKHHFGMTNQKPEKSGSQARKKNSRVWMIEAHHDKNCLIIKNCQILFFYDIYNFCL
jgi:hypothetical protein